CSSRPALSPYPSDTLEPDLAPERSVLAWAVCLIKATTGDALQHDAGTLHGQHPAGLLIQALGHTCLHPRGAAAIAGHLLLEAQTAVEPALVKGCLDLLSGLDADHLA